MDIRNTNILDLAGLMQSGAITSIELVEAFHAVIAAEDKSYNAVAVLNPEAGRIAKVLDGEREKGLIRSPLHGVPLLIKDNLNTGDEMPTTAGSVALSGSLALADSYVVARLRSAGAVILGKTNLSEWANFRSTQSSSGWSSRGGQVRNAYALERSPGGSSSGSAVAVARGFCCGAIGTETDGSILMPSSMNGVVGIKPTVGLVSRSGIVPISYSQDTAGPIARTVADAVCILTAVVGSDPADVTTVQAQTASFPNCSAFLNINALQDARIGVARNYAGFHDGTEVLFNEALELCKDAGATLVETDSLPSRGELKSHELLVLLTEFKVGLNNYLGSLPLSDRVSSLSDLITFNENNSNQVMPYFGQELLMAAQETRGLQDSAYLDALARCRRLARQDGIDKIMGENNVQAIVAPTAGPAWVIDWQTGDSSTGGSTCVAAIAGYPSITIPMGYVEHLPVGISFFGRPWSENTLIGMAHAFEKLFQARVLPRTDITPMSHRSANHLMS